jgi:hypothetical protein
VPPWRAASMKVLRLQVRRASIIVLRPASATRHNLIRYTARPGKNNDFLGNNVSRVAIEARCAAQKLNGRTGLMSLGSLGVLTFCPP